MKRVRLRTLHVEFEVAHMEDGETISDYFSQLLVIVNRLKSSGESIEDVHVVEKILRYLANKFEHDMVAIKEPKDLETLFIEELMGSLQVHEQCMKKNSSSVVIEQALESKLTLREEKPMASMEDMPIPTMAKVVEEEHSGADLVMDMEVIEMSNVSIAKKLDIMHQTAGRINMRGTMNYLILLRHQMLKMKNVHFFLHKRRQIICKRCGVLILELAIT